MQIALDSLRFVSSLDLPVDKRFKSPQKDMLRVPAAKDLVWKDGTSRIRTEVDWDEEEGYQYRTYTHPNFSCAFKCKSTHGIPEAHRVIISPSGAVRFTHHSIEALNAEIAADVMREVASPSPTPSGWKGDYRDLRVRCPCAYVLQCLRRRHLGQYLPSPLQSYIIDKLQCARLIKPNSNKEHTLYKFDYNAVTRNAALAKFTVLEVLDILITRIRSRGYKVNLVTTPFSYGEITFRSKSGGWKLTVEYREPSAIKDLPLCNGLYPSPIVVRLWSSGTNNIKGFNIYRYEFPALTPVGHNMLDLTYAENMFLSLQALGLEKKTSTKKREKYSKQMIRYANTLSRPNFKVKAKSVGGAHTGILQMDLRLVCAGPKIMDYLINKLNKAYNTLHNLDFIRDSVRLPGE